MSLVVENIRAGYDGNPVINNVSLELKAGKVVAIIGPNGSGKTTLIRVMSRVLSPEKGRVLAQARDIYNLTPGEVARFLAVVRQDESGEFPFTVEQMVMMGRFPHLSRFKSESSRDREVAHRAMELTGILPLRHRLLGSLSGGERQRATVARALAQEPCILLLDEPTNHLDISYQVEVLELVKDLAKIQGLVVGMVLHDLNLASMYGDEILLLDHGRVAALGSPEKVITPEIIEGAYRTPVMVTPHPVGGRPQVALLPRGAGCSPGA